MKKRTRVLSFIAFIMLSLVLVSCTKGKINLDKTEVTLNAGETHQINASFKDEKEFIYESSKTEIATVSETGLVTALTKGNAVITIKTKDSKVKAELKVIVNQEIEVDNINIELAKGMKEQLELPTGARVEIDNKYVAEIDDNGILEALSEGETVAKVYENDVLSKQYTIKVIKQIVSVTLNAKTDFYIDEVIEFTWNIRPLFSYNKFKFTVTDDTVLSIDEEGKVTALKPGTTKVRITSLQSDEIFDEVEVTVKQTYVVANASEVKIGNWTFKKDVDLFETVGEALEKANNTDKIILKDIVITENININKDVILEGDKGTVKGEILLNSKNIEIRNINFKEGSKVETDNNLLETFKFNNNTIEGVKTDFLSLEKYKVVEILNNKFIDIEGVAINLLNIDSSSTTLIEKNNIKNATTGVSLVATTRMKINTFIRMYRNVIDGSSTAIELDFGGNNKETNSEIYARFNEVTNYQIAVDSKDESKFELTFNYWGLTELDLTKFNNVDEIYLLGFYKNKTEILAEEKYNPLNPIIVDIEEVVEIIELGTKFQLKPIVLPYTADKANIIISIDDNNILQLSRTWELIPVRTGKVELLLSSLSSRDLAKTYEVVVTTDPGMLFELSNQSHGLNVGDKFEIKATPFPFNLADEKVTFKSSNDSIAKVNDKGEVTITGVGEFIITASVNGDVIFSETLEFTSYEDFDDNNVLDFVTQKQMTYSKYFEFLLYGTTMADSKLNESVTRVLMSNYNIYREDDYDPNSSDPKVNFPWFLPENTPGFRPSVPLNDNLPEEFKFNKENVVWIVVHDTGTSTAGSGAMTHAKYLYNQATQNGRQASWHYTVDAWEAYQHLPEGEVAYHAGDGSSIPGIDKESPALGGGNRNGIGIEMSVQSDGHVFKTWQNTAQLVGSLLNRYNLPLSHQRYHQDFSGKPCPQTMIRAGLVDFFEELVENEYELNKKFGNKIKSTGFVSHNPEIMNNDGTIVKTPLRSTQVSYTITIETTDNQVLTRTFNTLVEGSYR